MRKMLKLLVVATTLSAFGCASMGGKGDRHCGRCRGRGRDRRGPRRGDRASTTSAKRRRWAPRPARPSAAFSATAIGAYMDKQEADLRNAMASTIAQNNATIQRNNEQMLTATFKSDVFFDVNSAVLKPGGYAELDRVAHVLAQYPQTMIRIEGHTDQTGSEQYNLQLSERRATAVKNALVQKGVDPGRVMAAGMGECCPVSSDNAANRRVSMVLTTAQG